ncbi:hypothetical protein H1S01_17580 [Heliobacterium chlorum]|uniref:Uncharacterized protein n=1 Tax=Heliobacterium chlorum TaxID=2698 RepID=A0ABR7T675_HELCL|nr:hypothetical protein [Heliobacterium chlorum]MBC9786272.1 hypothetical protein [Heliobacterium chlorum]
MSFESGQIELDEVVRAFHIVWGEYPGNVLLVRKDRTVVAVNKMLEKAGGTVGSKCYSKNGSLCPWCKANEMFKKKVAVREVTKAHGLVFDSFWIPTPIEELYIHFGNDITQWVKPELL